MVEIIKEYPPNWDQIVAAFNPGPNILVAYGGKIFNPAGNDIPPELLAHEKMHIWQQSTTTAVIWWEKYISDKIFRLSQELQAHRAEYNYLIENGNRNDRRKAMKTISNRLAGPLYNYMIKPAEAKKLILHP